MSRNTNHHVIVYTGFEIMLDDETGRFIVAMPGDEDGLGDSGKRFDKLVEAKAYVDGVIKRRATVKRRSLALPVFYQPPRASFAPKGTPMPPLKTATVKGYHAGRGHPIFNEKDAPSTSGYSHTEIFVEHPYVRDLYARVEAKRKELHALLAEMKTFEVIGDQKATNGPAQYEIAIDDLEKSYQEALARAEALKPSLRVVK